jgi:hypothetical protein
MVTPTTHTMRSATDSTKLVLSYLSAMSTIGSLGARWKRESVKSCRIRFLVSPCQQQHHFLQQGTVQQGTDVAPLHNLAKNNG